MLTFQTSNLRLLYWKHHKLKIQEAQSPANQTLNDTIRKKKSIIQKDLKQKKIIIKEWGWNQNRK